jgi:exonuclease III
MITSHNRTNAPQPELTVASRQLHRSNFPGQKYGYPHDRHNTNTYRQHAALTPTIARENINMGDSLHLIISSTMSKGQEGDNSTLSTWRTQTIRLYFQNVNSLRLHDTGADIIETFLNMQEIQANIFGIAETQLHCRSPMVQGVLHNCKRKVWPHAKLFTSSSNEEWNAIRKPGGTLIGIVGPLVGRVKSHSADKYGRWTQVDLLGRSGQIISIICAYQVVQETGHHGDRTTHSQQVRMMRLEGQLQPNPQRQFNHDMKSLVKLLYKKGHDLVLMGDFNESIGANPLGMASVMTAGHLTDAFCHRHDLSQEKPTYARGNTRVDYILTSSRLLDYIQHTGAEPFYFRIFSDHRGLFVDFSYPGFFDRAPNILAKLHTRDLIYDCP